MSRSRRKLFHSIFLLLCIIALFSISAQPAKAQITLTEIKNPAGVGSISVNLTKTHDSKVILSWLEPQGNGVFALKFAVLQNNVWSMPRTVIAQREFIRYPAELPTVTQLGNRSFLALWTQNKAKTKEGEDAYFSQSRDGKVWSKPLRVHTDNSSAEHGLVSLLAIEPTKALAIWLDGRDDEKSHHSFLMQRNIESNGKLNSEVILDTDVCSCCPTAVVRSGDGLVLAYRDRSPENIRDISILRYKNGKWSESKNLYQDGWHLEGCPTNSVDLAASGEYVAAAWFTGANDKSKVKITFSQDAGAHFGEPVILNEGFTLGRASVAISSNGNAFATWVEQNEKGAQVMLKQVRMDGQTGAAVIVATGGAKGIGFPRIRETGKQAILTWIDDKAIRTAIVQAN